MSELTHYDEQGRPRMVDVSAKPDTERSATAHAFVKLSPAVLAALPHNPKGDPLTVARLAGVMAAKRTADLIPLCHPLPLTHADVEATVEEGGIRLRAVARTAGKTGVEMEALTAVTLAALTLYDMCKALDKGIEIQDVYLIEKTGGKSGVWRREQP